MITNTCPWINATVLYQCNADVYEDLNQLADNPFSAFTLYAGKNIYDVDSFMMDPDYIAEQLLQNMLDSSDYGFKGVTHKIYQYNGDYTQESVDDIFQHGQKMLEEHPEYQSFIAVIPGINQITLHYIYSI